MSSPSIVLSCHAAAHENFTLLHRQSMTQPRLHSQPLLCGSMLFGICSTGMRRKLMDKCRHLIELLQGTAVSLAGASWRWHDCSAKHPKQVKRRSASDPHKIHSPLLSAVQEHRGQPPTACRTGTQGTARPSIAPAVQQAAPESSCSNQHQH
jgi:hypothetical protein